MTHTTYINSLRACCNHWLSCIKRDENYEALATEIAELYKQYNTSR